MRAEPIAAVTSITYTLKELVENEREAGLVAPRDIACAILDKNGPEFFARLTRDEQEMQLSRLVAQAESQARSHGFRSSRVTPQGQEPMIRIAVAGTAYWSTTWPVDGTWKETRDLTPKDVETLIKTYVARASEMRARGLWLAEVLKMARAHHVETLGQLEKKGLDLPSLDVPEEDS